MRTLLRVAVSATFLAVPVVLVGMALSEPAYPQGSEHAKADVSPEPERTRPTCGMNFDTLVGLPGWRILEGKQLQAYMETLFKNVPNGDALAYIRHGDKVALVLGRNGCVVGRQVVPAKVHRRVVEKALGVIA